MLSAYALLTYLLIGSGVALYYACKPARRHTPTAHYPAAAPIPAQHYPATPLQHYPMPYDPYGIGMYYPAPAIPVYYQVPVYIPIYLPQAPTPQQPPQQHPIVDITDTATVH